MAYDNTNRGALFKNDKKESEKQPDYIGVVNVEGKDYRLAAWLKVGKKGKYMGLAVSEAQEQRSKKPDEDIPF